MCIGPVTVRSMRSPFIPSISASVVPSPPSASGFTITSASGFAARIPSLIAVPASMELKLPFNESIAITTFM